MIADDFKRDVYFNVPHPTLAWSVLCVSVREVGEHWEQAHEFQFPVIGMGTPFMGNYPSRDSAGRNGLCFLRRALMRVTREDREKAQEHAEAIWEIINPQQRELALS